MDHDDQRGATTVGVRELRAALATHLRRAASGDRVIVTVDGRPVAQLGPVTPDQRPTLDDLIAAGLVEAPRRDDRPDPPEVGPLASGASVIRALEELRGR